MILYITNNDVKASARYLTGGKNLLASFFFWRKFEFMHPRLSKYMPLLRKQMRLDGSHLFQELDCGLKIKLGWRDEVQYVLNYDATMMSLFHELMN